MIKVYVTGFDRPYGITGELISENEQHIIVTENGVNKRISQEKIIYIEEYDSVPKVLQQPAPSFTPLPIQKPVVASISNIAPVTSSRPTPEMLQELLKRKQAMTPPATQPVKPLSEIDPMPLPLTYDITDTMMVEVNFNGVKQGKFDISLPKGVMTGKYTPALGREVFAHKEIKNILSDGNTILDGVPVVKENKVFYTTKSTKTEQTGQDKIKMMGQLASAGTTMMGLQGALLSGEKPVSSIQKNDFSMPSSPFDVVPTLSLQEGDDGE